MFASIMRSLGYVPFDALVQAENELANTKIELDTIKTTSKKVLDGIKARESAGTKIINDLEAELVRTRNGRDLFSKVTAAIISGTGNPSFTVTDDGKTLALQAVLDADMLVIKSTVKNKKNLDHLTALARSLNLMMIRRGELVSRMVRDAMPAPAVPADEPIPLDAPTGKPHSGESA